MSRNTEAALNHLSGRPSAALDEAALASVVPKTATDEPTLAEVTRAILKLKIIRAAEPNGNPPELHKCAINPLSGALRSLVIQAWRSGHIPADWRDGIVIVLYKGKGI